MWYEAVYHECCFGYSLCHTVLDSTIGTAVFGSDMLFDLLFLANWNKIGCKRQNPVDNVNEKVDANHINFDFALENKVMAMDNGIDHKSMDKQTASLSVTQVHSNETIRIQWNGLIEHLNLVTPFFQ